MQPSEIIRQAWQQVLHHRSLWLFGIILALTTFSWSSLATLSRTGGDDQSEPGIQIQRRSYETFGDALERSLKEELDSVSEELEDLVAQELDLQVNVDIVTILASLLGIGVILYLLVKSLRYISEVALIRLIDQDHQAGVRAGIREGFRLGWSRVAFRLFLIAVVINLVATAVGLLLMTLIFSPLPLWVDSGEEVVAAGAIITAALFFLAIFFLILGGMGATLVRILAWRVAVLEGKGVIASVYRGFSLLRHNLRALLPLALVGLGVNLTYPTLIAVLAVPLFAMGLLIGGLPGLVLGGVASLSGAGETALVLGITVAALILMIVIAAPLAFVDGLREIFLSSIWTQAFRRLLQLEVEMEQSPPKIASD